MNGALDLALTKHWVHGSSYVVHGEHLVNLAGRTVEDHELSRVGEHGMNDRVLDALVQRIGPIDPVLPLVIDARPAAVGESVPARVGDRACAHDRAPRACRLAGPELPCGIDHHANPRRVDPKLLDGDWSATVCTPWPISVQQWRTSTVPSSKKRTTALITSKSPFPRPEFLSPKPRPTAFPSATASS